MAYTEGSIQRAWELERNVVKQTRKLKSINDVSLSFAKNPLTNDIVIKDNTGTIVQGIKFLLKTQPFEIPFQPDFYCNIQAYLFEQINEVTAESIKSTINDAINSQASDFVDLKQINVVPRANENGYSITIIVSPKKEKKTITITEFLEVE
jgi:phage baseplate assembly protein W